MSALWHFVRTWTLPLAMIAGAAAYFIYVSIPWLDGTHRQAAEAIAVLQPLLIFAMLFLTFCRIDPAELRVKGWHLRLVLLQTALFAAATLLLLCFPDTRWRVLIESAMLCLLCPTATAASVVTARLDDNAASITAYTMLVNLVMAVAAPLLLPLAHPHAELGFAAAFALIIRKVFPLLICPLVAALAMRRWLPRLHARCAAARDAAFYLWAVSLSLAIAVTTKAIVHEQVHVGYQIGIALVSLGCCLAQFLLGKRIGGRAGERIEGGQALGQKNTVFIIWMGYTFLSPITALAGGFYSVWHNVVNSYQLYKKERQAAKPQA